MRTLQNGIIFLIVSYWSKEARNRNEIKLLPENYINLKGGIALPTGKQNTEEI
jgi:hypothetical protein